MPLRLSESHCLRDGCQNKCYNIKGIHYTTILGFNHIVYCSECLPFTTNKFSTHSFTQKADSPLQPRSLRTPWSLSHKFALSEHQPTNCRQSSMSISIYSTSDRIAEYWDLNTSVSMSAWVLSSGTVCTNFTKFSVHVASGHSSVLSWQPALQHIMYICFCVMMYATGQVKAS